METVPTPFGDPLHRSILLLACTALLAQGPQKPVTKKAWRAFLRAHPHHLEARSALLQILRKDAEKRTQELFGTRGKTAEEVLREGQSGLSMKKIMAQPLPTLPKILAPTLDEALWGPWVREMEGLFVNGDWLHTNLRLSGADAKPMEIHSPMVQRLYRRHLPKVEAALRRWPTQIGFDSGLWDLWGWMGRALPGYPMVAFVDSLVPLPDQDPLEWPPHPARMVTPHPLSSCLPLESTSRPPFLYPLRRNPSPCVVVLDTPEGAWGPAFQSLLRQEPPIGLGLPLFVLPTADVEAVTLRNREGWEEGPRWCLLNHQGRLLYESRTLPTAKTLERAFQEHGGPTRVESLRAFLAQNPAHAEARLVLLGALKAIAEARTSAQFGLQNAKGPDQGFRMSIGGFQFRKYPIPPVQTPEATLPDALDAAIWGDFAAVLDEIFLHEAWWGAQGSGFAFPGDSSAFDSPLAARSLRVRAVLGRRIGEVEEALIQRPDDTLLWNLWLKWSEALGDRSIRTLLDRLTPLPDAKPGTWPPESVRGLLFREARAGGDWVTARASLDPAWEELLGMSRKSNPFLLEDAWAAIGGPRMEALLRLGRLAEAETMLSPWMEDGGWSGAPGEAARLARTLGQSGLAARWEGMR